MTVLILQTIALKERIIYLHLSDIGYAKTNIALKTLAELGLITENGGALTCPPSSAKTELYASKTYNELSKGGI